MHYAPNCVHWPALATKLRRAAAPAAAATDVDAAAAAAVWEHWAALATDSLMLLLLLLLRLLRLVELAPAVPREVQGDCWHRDFLHRVIDFAPIHVRVHVGLAMPGGSKSQTAQDEMELTM